MNCQELVDFLMEYLEGELPPEHQAAFEEHLRLCPPCVHFLATYKEAIVMGKICCQCSEAIPKEVPEDLVQAILAARRAK
ncbi:MAG: zf-HC2 domain-containing protein [Planctomycetales bacterium]|nr:zf-HC2 domain-containing protein [Planctomycetales bacterium]